VLVRRNRLLLVLFPLKLDLTVVFIDCDFLLNKWSMWHVLIDFCEVFHCACAETGNEEFSVTDPTPPFAIRWRYFHHRMTFTAYYAIFLLPRHVTLWPWL